MKRAIAIVALVTLPGGVADAGNMRYSYDARGRLVSVCETTNATGQLTRYSHDTADNRQNYSDLATVQSIPAGSARFSQDGRFQLAMQGDGHFVLYGNLGSGWTPLWYTGTAGTTANVAIFQSDGNLVLYNSSGAVFWASGTWAPCATLSVQNDGNVVIKNPQGAIIWQTNTGGH